MKFKVDNITSMIFYDSNHLPFFAGVAPEHVIVDTEAEGFEMDGIPSNPNIGDHIYLIATLKDKNTLEIDGFYGGLVD